MQERCTIACAIHEGLITVQYVELGKLKKIFEKRKLLNIAMESLLRTSGSVSSGLILVGSIYRVRSIMKLILSK